MRSIRLLFTLLVSSLVSVAASCLPALAAGAVTSPSSRTVGNPANAVKLSGYVETAGQTITVEAVDQNTGQVVMLGTATAATSGTPHTTPSGKHYTAYRWTFDAGVMASNYWAPQTIVADVATSQGHLELIATAGNETLRTFSAAARASAKASHDDPQTAAARFADGTSTVLFDTNGVGSGPETKWVQVQGMISDSHSKLYSPVAWSVGSYTVENGLKVYALICSPTTGGPYPVVIYNHGGTGSGDGGNLNGVVTASGWTAQPVLLGANGQPVLGPNGLPIPVPDSLGQCLDWAKRGWVFATSAYRGESVVITSQNPSFPTPAQPWKSDGNVEFCMGEVTDVMALTDLLVKHAHAVTLGSTAEKVAINPNGEAVDVRLLARRLYHLSGRRAGRARQGVLRDRRLHRPAPELSQCAEPPLRSERRDPGRYRRRRLPARRLGLPARRRPCDGIQLALRTLFRLARRCGHRAVQDDADRDLSRRRRYARRRSHLVSSTRSCSTSRFRSPATFARGISLSARAAWRRPPSHASPARWARRCRHR